MARYEIAVETDRSRVTRQTGKLPATVKVLHGARSMEHAIGALLELTVWPDGMWELRGDKLHIHSSTVHDDASDARPFHVGGALPNY